MRLSSRLLILFSVAFVAFALFFYILSFPLGEDHVDKNNDNNQQQTEETAQNESPKGEAVSALVCGTDETGLLTDVIFLAMYDVDRAEINLLQIPRDSYIGEDYRSGKINAVYGQYKNHEDGIGALEEIIEEQFLVPVDYTAVISLEAFKNIIDGLGGVKMVVDRQIEFMPGKVLYEGEQVLNGEQCEWIVRYRKGYPTGDVGRMEQQRKFLSAMINTVRDRGRIKAVGILVENYSSINTDMPKKKAISYANKVFLEVPDNNINVFTATGDGVYNNSYAVYQLNREDLAEVLNEGFRPYSEDVTANELKVAVVPNPIYPEYNNIKDNKPKPFIPQTPYEENLNEADEINEDNNIEDDTSNSDNEVLEDFNEEFTQPKEENYDKPRKSEIYN